MQVTARYIFLVAVLDFTDTTWVVQDFVHSCPRAAGLTVLCLCKERALRGSGNPLENG